MNCLKKVFILFSILHCALLGADDSATWIYGTLEEVSYIKNNSNQVETVFNFSLEKHQGLKQSEVINYMKFRVYSEGGAWDGVNYPISMDITSSVGKGVLAYLSKKSGKFYIERAIPSPSDKVVESLKGVRTQASYQLGFSAGQERKKRKPAQIDKDKSLQLEDFGFFTFSLFLIVFGVSLYFVSRKNNYD